MLARSSCGEAPDGPNHRTLGSGHTHWINAVAFSPKDGLLASGCNDGTVKLWDRITGQERATMRANAEAVNAVAFSPDGKVLASGGDDNMVRLWDTATREGAATFRSENAHIYAVAFSADGRLLLSGGDVYDEKARRSSGGEW